MSMSKSPIAALFWRQWRETRVALIGGVAFALVMAVSFAMAQATGAGSEPQELNLFAGFVAGFVAIGAGLSILFSHADGARLTSALTPQWLTLPVRGWKLAAAFVFYRFTAFGAVVGLSLLILHGALTTDAYYDAAESAGPRGFAGVLSPAGAIVFWFAAMSLFAVAQGVEWTLRLVSSFLAWAVYAVVFGLLLVLPEVEAELTGEGTLFIAAAIAWTFGAALTFAGVIAQRRGLLNAVEAPAIMQPARRAKRPFRSPDAALRWLEWRVAGRWLLGCGLLVTTATFVLGPLRLWTRLMFFRNAIDDFQYGQILGGFTNAAETTFQVSLMFAFLAAVLVGVCMTFVRRRTVGSGAGLCYAAAPVTTARLAKASFLSAVQVVACIVLGAAVAAGISAALAVSLSADIYLDGKMYQEIIPFVAILFPLALFAAYLSAGFTMPVYLAALLIALGVSLAAGSDLTLDDGAFPVFSVMAAFGVGGCAVYAFRHGHYGARGVIGLCAAAGAMALMIHLSFEVGDTWTEMGANASANYAAACAAAIAPLAFWPAYLAWLRTR